MARSDVTDYLVAILEGPRRGEQIALAGRAAPYKAGSGGSISYGEEQRSKLVWYQGNPTATHLVFGPRLLPTTVNGTWKDRYLGTDSAIALVESFENLVDTGVQVRVEWETVERRGIVKTINWKPGDPTGGLTDIAWELQFEWNSKGEPPQRNVGQSRGSLRDSVTSAAQIFSSFKGEIQALITSFESFVSLTDLAFSGFKNVLQNAFNDSDQAAKTLFSNAGRIGDELDLTPKILEDTSTAFAKVSDSTASLLTQIANTFPPLTSKLDDVDILLLQALDRIQIVEDGFTALVAMFDARYRIEQIARPDAFVFVRPLKGGDLRQVAIEFYGSADRWKEIAAANGISGSLIPDDVDSLYVPITLMPANDPANSLTGQSDTQLGTSSLSA